MRDAKHRKVDPYASISFLLVEKTSRSSILQFVSILTTFVDINFGPAAGEFQMARILL